MPASVHSRRRSRAFAVAILALVLAALPLGALASHNFADVLDSNMFHADIDALADSGVTTGCGGGNYCPSAFVTREQMAAFMNRLGALAPGKVPVVNAATAVDSDTLDGLDSADFMPSGGVAIDTIGTWFTGTTNASVQHYANLASLNSSVVQTAYFWTHLVGPRSIGTQDYALTELRLCAAGYSNATLAYINVIVGTGLLAEDLTPDNPPFAGLCYTLTVDTPIISNESGLAVNVAVAYTAAGLVQLSLVRSTWAPYTPPA